MKLQKYTEQLISIGLDRAAQSSHAEDSDESPTESGNFRGDLGLFEAKRAVPDMPESKQHLKALCDTSVFQI